MLPALLTLSAVTLSAPQDSKPDFVARGTFDSDWAKIKSLGVCRISAEDIGCWDMEGKYDVALRDRARILIESYSSGFQFIYGKKNRYLAVEVASPSLSFRSADGNYTQEYTIHRGYREPKLSLINVAFEPNQATGSLVAEAYSVNQGVPVKIPFKEGQKAQFDGWSIEVGGSKPAPDRSGYAEGPYDSLGKRWFIFVSSYFESGGVPYRLDFGLVDKSGRPIQYVDLKGHIVSAAAYAKEMAGRPDTGYVRERADPGRKPPRYVPVSTMTAQAFGAAQTYITNVDPKFIGELYVTRSRSLRVEMEGFPLDPVE